MYKVIVPPSHNNLKNMEENEKTFRIKNKRLMLTYKTHLNKKKLEEYFNNLCKPKNIEVLECHIAHENGKDDKETPYEHTHIMLRFSSAFESINSRIFDITRNKEILHPHIQPCKSESHWLGWYKYLAKEDKENEHLLKLNKEKYIATPEDIWKCENIQEAIRKYGSNLKLINYIKTAYELKPEIENKCTYDDLILHKWQLDLLEILKQKPSDRKIMWVYGEKGCEGKTIFGKMLFNKKQAIHISYLKESKNMTETIKNILEQNSNNEKINTLIIDVPRAQEIGNDLFIYLEKLKDNEVIAEKYRSKKLILNNGLPFHLIIFSNQYPKNVNYNSVLSLDRWIIYEINKNLTDQLDLIYKSQYDTTDKPIY